MGGGADARSVEFLNQRIVNVRIDSRSSLFPQIKTTSHRRGAKDAEEKNARTGYTEPSAVQLRKYQMGRLSISMATRYTHVPCDLNLFSFFLCALCASAVNRFYGIAGNSFQAA
jgi:hypothetical protein